MLSPITADTVSVDLGNGSAIEYSHDVLEELRRLAVAGYVAFGRGGLEIGGVLYGRRDGTRLTIHGSAEFASEHARGPGFLFSENDRKGFAQLLQPPLGLETLGWYRTHTRSDLHLDAGDRELFGHFPANGKIIGLVLKPTHWGPSAAAFYMREGGGEIVPQEPLEFAVHPPERPRELRRLEEPQTAVADQTMVVATTEPPAELETAQQPVQLARVAARPWSPAPRRRLPIAIFAAVILVAVTALAARFRARNPHNLGLQAYAVAPGQLRVDWNRTSLPVIEGVSGVVEIRDGENDTQIALTASQLRLSSVTYTQKTGHVEVDLRVEGGEPGAASTRESIEFVGPAAASVPLVAANATPPVQSKAATPVEADSGTAPASSGAIRHAPSESLADRSGKQAGKQSTEQATERLREQPVKPSVPTQRRFELPTPRKNSIPEPSLLPALPPAPLPAASPALAIAQSQRTVLPDLLPKTAMVPRPVPPPKAEPRSGRLIWTGKLGRHEIVEIEGGRSSVGTMSGKLSGTPAEFRILPAEFTRDGLAVYSTDGSIHGRTEPPSASNGWNLVTFEFDPVRVKELVVLEAPSRLNSFQRLVLRCESRVCPVVVVDWTTR